MGFEDLQLLWYEVSVRIRAQPARLSRPEDVGLLRDHGELII
jgi:hypothetical protein